MIIPDLNITSDLANFHISELRYQMFKKNCQMSKSACMCLRPFTMMISKKCRILRSKSTLDMRPVVN